MLHNRCSEFFRLVHSFIPSKTTGAPQVQLKYGPHTVLVCSLHGSVNANVITPQSIYNAVHPCWQHFRYVSFTLLHPLNLNTPHHLIAEFIGTWLLILQCRLFSVDRVWLVHKHLSHLGMQFKTRT